MSMKTLTHTIEIEISPKIIWRMILRWSFRKRNLRLILIFMGARLTYNSRPFFFSGSLPLAGSLFVIQELGRKGRRLKFLSAKEAVLAQP